MRARGAGCLSLVLVACSSSSGSLPAPADAGSDDAGLPPDSGVSALAQQLAAYDQLRAEAECAQLARCQPLGFARRYGQPAACVEMAREGAPWLAVVVETIGAGRTHFDAARVADCAAEVRDADCELGPPVDGACAEVLVGTSGWHMICSTPYECGPGLSCPYGPAPSCALCEEDAQEGEACSSSSGFVLCAPGLTEILSGSGCVCRRLPGVDEACTDFCQGALECANGRCARHLSPGAPCGGSIPGHCVQEHQCLDGSCQRLPQVEAGAHCPSDLSCPRELICAHSAQDVCQPGPGVGEACDVGACALGLYCEPGRELCRAYAALGDSCIDETCGPGLYCDQRPGGWTCAERALRWHYCP